jgi:hypothetical protein
MKQQRVSLPLIIVWASASACTGERSDSLDSQISARPIAVPSESSAPAVEGHLELQASEELVQAAENIIAFLRGQESFERIRLADTVTLYLGREGGGTRREIPRESLRDRATWRVRSDELGTTYQFTPPAGLSELTTSVGRHYKCRDNTLSSQYGELAQLPHVGTKLAPPNASSCLQSWNLTLVFAAEERPPILVAAVYDQWEW